MGAQRRGEFTEVEEAKIELSNAVLDVLDDLHPARPDHFCDGSYWKLPGCATRTKIVGAIYEKVGVDEFVHTVVRPGV